MRGKRSIYSNRLYLTAKRSMFEGLFRTGALHAFRRMHRHSPLVLIYHDILAAAYPADNPLFGMTVSATEFEWQLGYLRKNYNPITFQQFANWFVDGLALPPNPVLLTFDDGHSNNFEFALPILKKYGMSAVFFVVAASLGRKSLTWFEDAYYRLMFSPASSWHLNNGEVWPLNSPEQRVAACGRFFTLCRDLRERNQSLELEFLRSQLNVPELNGHFPGRFEFLSSEQLRSLRDGGMEIGAHSMTHPVLAAASDHSSRSEIQESKRELERVLGTPVRAFAYPFGVPDLDFSGRDANYCRESGFRFAFAGEGGFVGRENEAFTLPRVGIGRMTRAQFAATITGATESLKRMASMVSITQ